MGPSSRPRETKHPNRTPFPVLKEHTVRMLLSPRPEQLLGAILESSEEAILGVALDGTIESWSRGAERVYGYAAAEITGQPLKRLLPLHEIAAHEKELGAARAGEVRCHDNAERLHKDGSLLQVAVRHTPLRDEEGRISGILESGRVLHGKKNGTLAETQLRLLAEQMPVVLWTTDRNLRITSNWGSEKQLARVQPGELEGRTIFEYLNCPDPKASPIAQHYAALRGESSHFEYQHWNRVMDVHLEPLRAVTGEIIGCIGVGVDITERKKSEDEIRFQATHDALTGLANYREFVDTLEREIGRAERSRHSFTVMLLDLDDLKRINDRLGHLAGNRALKRLAARIKDHGRSTDLAARYGGDEFAVILIESDLRMAEQVAERIESCLRNDEEEPRLTVSIGTGIYPNDGRTAQELLEAADQRLYRRKKMSEARSASSN